MSIYLVLIPYSEICVKIIYQSQGAAYNRDFTVFIFGEEFVFMRFLLEKRDDIFS